MTDGQIVVNTKDKGIVRLVLNGADITCSTSAPIYVLDAEKVVIVLAEGTENHITDGNSYMIEGSEEDEPNAAIFSMSDLTINGNGSLTVDANYNDAITSKDELKITSGNITIDSADDSIHSNDRFTMNGGNIMISSGDDGIHSDSALEMNGGDINITKSYEGIESTAITINGGSIHIASSDDGVNIAGGNDASSMNGRSGQNNFKPTGNNYLDINGGYIAIDAAGDGIDVNGSITMTQGVAIVNGPTANNNGALNYDGSFRMTGGFLVAAGSSGMAKAPDTSSTQYSVIMAFTSSLPAGTMVHIETDKGEGILTFVPTKQYQTVVICSPELKNGSSYNVYYGGSSTGAVKDGLYADGAYTAGTRYTGFTISGIVTGIGSYNNGNRGGRRP